MKKGLLRALSAVVAISMLFCMSMVAFADGVSQNVVTTYNPSAGTVTVTTEVTGAQSGEQVAFLVEKTTGENTEIIWIDQQPATGGTVTSSFTATVDEAIGAKAKVGTTSVAASEETTKTINWEEYDVTWSVESSNGSKVVAYFGNTTKDSSVEADEAGFKVKQNEANVEFYILAAPNEKLVSVNGNEEFELVGNAYAVTINKESTKVFNFVFGPKTIESVKPSSTVDLDNCAEYNSSEKYASVIATAVNADEYGILVALDASDLTEEAVDTAPTGGTEAAKDASVIKLHAMGSNSENVFVIKIDDSEGTFFTGSTYWAAVYTKNTTGVDVSTAFQLN